MDGPVPASGIHGRVVDDHGRPVDGARVLLFGEVRNTCTRRRVPLAETTSSRGWFAFPQAGAPPVGWLFVKASARGHADGHTPCVSLRDWTTHSHEIVLPRLGENAE